MAELVVLYRYEYDVRGACFAAHGAPGGFLLSAGAPAYIDGMKRDWVLRSDTYGLFDVAGAASRGYRPSKKGMLTAVGPRNVSTEAERVCAEQVEKTIHGGDSMSYANARVLPDGGPKTAAEDSRYRTAVSRWADCMHRRGYSFKDPLEPMRKYAEVEGPSQEEIAAAQADVGCKVSTNLVGVASAVQSALDRQYISEHVTQLAGFRASVQDLLRAAVHAG